MRAVGNEPRHQTETLMVNRRDVLASSAKLAAKLAAL